MSCLPTYKGKRYNSLEELYRANGINSEQKQQALGFKTNITQDNKSYYRGQLKPFKIDRNGNLILEPQGGILYPFSFDKKLLPEVRY